VKVWVSRSRPGAERQAAALREAGYEPVVAPVIEIETLEQTPPEGPFDTVIFLSEHAVRLGLPALEQLPWFAGTQRLAVGARTAAGLELRGLNVAIPPVATSEGLLDLTRLRRLQRRRVLLVTGAGGRSLLDRELVARGALVRRLECYRRVVRQRLEADVHGCDAVIAASGEGLRQVATLWLGAGGRADVPVLVPSARVARLGVELGLFNLHDCGGADSDAWLRGLAQLQSAGTS
jgi:uroporphyrinogen-III synthase